MYDQEHRIQQIPKSCCTSVDINIEILKYGKFRVYRIHKLLEKPETQWQNPTNQEIQENIVLKGLFICVEVI